MIDRTLGLGRHALIIAEGSFHIKSFFIACVLISFLLHAGGAAGEKEIKRLLDTAGIKSDGDRRGQMDIIGFASTAEQMNEVMRQCSKLAKPAAASLSEKTGWKEDAPLIAAVCPHDDYYYAGRFYSLLLPHIRAKTVILFGVFHKARIFKMRDRLVFGSFRYWHGPYGPVRVSPLRGEILQLLPKDDFVVDNDMQSAEHSVEAIVPFLQAYNKNVEIISILVPYMDWPTLDRLSGDVSRAVAEVIKKKKLKLGRDVAFICSTDAVHYGDAGWGGRNFAPFGSGPDGHEQAAARDMQIIESCLLGRLTAGNLEKYLYTCVDSTDVSRYLVTWCGRFSVPFGLKVAMETTSIIEKGVLTGTLLGYGTSVSEQSLDLELLPGMGPTAPNNFHHFVGYAAIGYLVP